MAASGESCWPSAGTFLAAYGENLMAVDRSTVEITDFTPLAFASSETDVIVPVRFGYTVRATGKTVSMTMQHWWRFSGEKVVFFRGAEDTEQSAAAFA